MRMAGSRTADARVVAGVVRLPRAPTGHRAPRTPSPACLCPPAFLQFRTMHNQLSGAVFFVLLLLSGVEAAVDAEGYLAAGCHCVLGKDLRMTETIRRLKVAYLRLHPPALQP